MISSLIDFFVYRGDERIPAISAFRAKVLVLSSLFTAVFLIPFLFLRVSWEGIADIKNCVLWTALFILVTAPFIYKKTRSIRGVGIYVNFGSTLVAMTYAFLDGGFYSTALHWYPILPLFAVFYSGVRYGLVIAAILFVNVVFLYYAHVAGFIPPITISEESMTLLHFISIVSVAAIVLTLACLYLFGQQTIQKELVLANSAKNDFLSGVSHELRTPLNSILGFSDVLTRGYVGDLNEKQVEYVGYINLCGDHLLALVDGLLDIAKIESGKFELELKPVCLPELFASVLHIYRSKAEEKQTKASFTVDDCIAEYHFNVDEIKLTQVIINLVGNAIKFSPPESTVLIDARYEKGSVVIEVIDNGPGVPAELHDKIFDRFFQINTASAGKDPGAGLGLAISRFFIEMHSGKLYLSEADEGAGSRFVCDIPSDKLQPIAGTNDEWRAANNVVEGVTV